MKSIDLGRMIAFLGCLTLATSGAASSQDRVHWKMHSPFPSKIPLMGSGGTRLAENLTQMSDGSFVLEFSEPGNLASGIHYFDQVSAGLIEAAWGFSNFHEDKAPALTIFAGLPFGPRAGPYLAWMKFGGGEEFRDDIYQDYGVKGFTCGVLPPEAGGWFRQEIVSLDKFSGLKMRAFGFGAKVLERLGANTQQLAGGDIVPALELGTIDAAEFSAPAIDEGFKFVESVKHYQFPGWQAQWTLVELLVNRESYEKLSAQNKALLKNACGNNIFAMLAEGEALQFAAMDRMTAAGAVMHHWPESVIEALRGAWSDVAAEAAAKDPLFKKVYGSYMAFRNSHKMWSDLAYVD